MKFTQDDYKKKKGIKDSTIKTYWSNLKRVIKLFDKNVDDDLSFFKDFDKVKEKIKDIPITSKKNVLTSIIVMLSVLDINRDKYSEYLIKLDKEYNETQLEQKMTAKQKKNWTSVSEIQNVIKKVKHEINRKKLFKGKKELTAKDKDLIQKYLILSLYNEFHIRNDFANVMITSNKLYRKMKEEDKKKSNWLVITKRKKRFEFYNFKTSKFKKLPMAYNIPTNINTILNKWLNINKSENLLINQKGRKLSANMITKILQNVFHRYLGKKISTSLLRHIYISHTLKADKSYKEKEEMAEKFQHTVKTQEKYRKIDEDEKK